MTEAGKKWVDELANGRYPITVHREEAEFWLRAFCQDVLTRAAVLKEQGHIVRHGSNVDLGQAFDELKRNLLGEK